MQEVAKDRVVLTSLRKKVIEEVRDIPKGCRESATNEVPADDEDGRCASTSQSTAAKKAAAVGQACCGSGNRHHVDLTHGEQPRRLTC